MLARRNRGSQEFVIRRGDLRFALGCWILWTICLIPFASSSAAAPWEPPSPLEPFGPIQTATPTYRWSVVEGAAWYQLWVNDSTGTAINRWYTASQVNASSGECSVTPLEEIALGTARWWVRAWSNSQGNGPWSLGLEFAVELPLESPLPISPVGTTSDPTPTYRWSVVEGATWYQLWVNDSTGTAINRWYTASQVNASSGECSVTPLEEIALGTARWWVRAWRPQTGNGPWSVGTSFSVIMPTAVPVPVEPIGPTPSASPTYRWSVVEGATWYQLWVNDSTGTAINRWYAASQVNASSGECSVTPLEAIAWGPATWWVRAWGPGAGNGSWSAATGFRPYLGPLSWATIIELDPSPTEVVEPSLRAAIIATGLPWKVRDLASSIEMLLVPSGNFAMGCSPSLEFDCLSDENPTHEVTLTRSFYLGQFEVTQQQWESVLGFNPSEFAELEDSPERPVERVTWTDVQGFEEATGLRLPTEAEWEFACRAGTETAFNNGSDADGSLDMIGWYDGNAGGETRPVGMLNPNGLGFYDMHGNVFEWVEDWYGINYYSTSPLVDPAGPSSGSSKVIRGGSWFNFSRECRSSYRSSRPPVFAVHDYIGFRVAKTP